MLRLLMICIMVLLMTLIVTQVLLPAIKGHKLFPLFRSNLREAESDLEDKKVNKEVRAIQASAIRMEAESDHIVHDALDEVTKDWDQQRVVTLDEIDEEIETRKVRCR